jgi:hypothetical protein
VINKASDDARSTTESGTKCRNSLSCIANGKVDAPYSRQPLPLIGG